MEKLMKYVEQMQKEWINVCRPQVQQYDILYMILISKHYPLIKWLVENDKIDLKEFHKLCWIINQDSEYWNWTPQDYEQVIMYLSISDTPIEDLVSLLK